MIRRRSEGETVTSGILDPGVVVGAFDAGVQSEGLPGQLASGEGAGVGKAAERLALDCATALPLLEIPQRHCACWVLHPLNDLELSDKVDIVVGGGNVGHPLVEDLGESLVGDQPGGVEGEREGSAVGAVVALKVVVQQLPAKHIFLC